STISGNLARQAGGGIYAQGGTLNVVSSSVAENTADGEANCWGGGIAASNAQVTISHSNINNNAVFGSNVGTPAAPSAAGGGIYAQGGTLTTTGAAISANTAVAATSGTTAASIGGAVGTSGTVVSINGGTIENNSLSTVASQVATMQGSAFSTVG